MTSSNASRSYSLLRAIRGPVLLITLGTLLMLDYSASVSFARTWPVLLIVLGALKLAEHVGGGAA